MVEAVWLSAWAPDPAPAKPKTAAAAEIEAATGVATIVDVDLACTSMLPSVDTTVEPSIPALTAFSISFCELASASDRDPPARPAPTDAEPAIPKASMDEPSNAPTVTSPDAV